jgi:hypothetical protein
MSFISSAKLKGESNSDSPFLFRFPIFLESEFCSELTDARTADGVRDNAEIN